MDDEEDFMICFSHVNLGAALAGIFSLSSCEVTCSRSYDSVKITVVKSSVSCFSCTLILLIIKCSGLGSDV